MLALTTALAVGLPSLETDNSTDSFLHPDDPIRQVYDDFRGRYGRDERISIAAEGDLFDPVFLERLRALHEELEREVPHVEDMISMVNARSTRGEGDELIVGDLMADWPESPEARAVLRERVLANPLFVNTLISQDATVTTLSIELVAFADDAAADELAGFDDADAVEGDGGPAVLSERAISEAVNVVQEVVERHRAPGFDLILAGAPVMSERLNRRMALDMGLFTLLSIVMIGLVLFLLFRRLAAVLLPLLVVVLSMVGTLGVISLTGGKLSIATQILPSFLLAVGVCDAVHILSIFYQRLSAGDARHHAIAATLGHSGLAVVMTSVTTAGGFASFAVGDFKPVADLGLYAPFGVMFALLYTLVLLPALLAVIPSRPPTPSRDRAADLVTRVLERVGDFAADHAWGVVSVTVAMLVTAGAGATFLKFSHDPVDWFPPDDPFRISTLYMNDRLGGVNVVEVVAKTGKEGGVKEPDFLERLDQVRVETSRIHHGPWHIAKAVSVADVVKEIHQALNENRGDHYRIPADRALVAQELLLFENSGSDDLTDLVDPLYSEARITLRVPWLDAMLYPAALADLERRIGPILGEGVETEITGLVPMLAGTLTAMIHSMARSYLLAILVIAPLMVLLIGNLRWGLLSMIPNLTPVVLMLGWMGWASLPVDGLTMMVGAIVLGLAVDDTIHFMHNYRRYYERTGDPRAAIRATLHTTGRALLVTSLVLAAGFFVFLGAYMDNVKLFGVLTGGAILVAFVANVLLASSLMMLASRRRELAAEGPASGVQAGPRLADDRGMDDAALRGAGEMEVTAEEDRFLRRFFRRQLMPWAAALVVISVTLSLMLGDEDAVEVEARTSAAVAQLRSENQRLAAELEQLDARLAKGLSARESTSGNELERRIEDAKHNVRMIESRVTAKLERRLDSLEAQLGQGGAPASIASAPRPRPSAGAPPPDASAWDVSQILDRLYAVEMAQQEGGAGATDGRRLGEIEERIARLETSSSGLALPANLAPPQPQ
jgi:predicted RND superfamily exporter protein